MTLNTLERGRIHFFNVSFSVRKNVASKALQPFGGGHFLHKVVELSTFCRRYDRRPLSICLYSKSFENVAVANTDYSPINEYVGTAPLIKKWVWAEKLIKLFSLRHLSFQNRWVASI